MKRITLYSPADNNAGDYLDAGSTIEIGDEPAEITADRAKDLVDGHRAVSATKAKAETKTETETDPGTPPPGMLTVTDGPGEKAKDPK